MFPSLCLADTLHPLYLRASSGSTRGMDDVGLAAGRTQREKKRSYKDLLREEEETAAQVRETSKKRSKDSDPLFPSPEVFHKKKKKSDDGDYGDFSSPEPAKKKKNLDVPFDSSVDVLKTVATPVTAGSKMSKKAEKSPSSSSSSSSFSPPGYLSYSEGRKEHKKKKSSSSQHSPVVADDILHKSKKLKTPTVSTETLTLREPDGLKMKLIVSPKEETVPPPRKISKKSPQPNQDEPCMLSLSAEPTPLFHKSPRKKIKLDPQLMPSLQQADSYRHEGERGSQSRLEMPTLEPLDTGSSSGGEQDAGELVIDDSSRGSKKKKKSKKSKKKKDKEKHKEDRHKDDKHKEEKHREEKHKEDRHKEDRHRQEKRKDDKHKDDRRKEDRRKEDRHKEDKHKEDKHKEDKHKEDKHKDDKHKEDKHKEDKHREDKHKEDKHKEDRHKEDRHREDRHKEDKHKEDKHKEEKRKEEKRKEERHREDKHKEERHKEDKHREEKHKEDKHKEEKHRDEKHKEEKRKEDKHKEKKHVKPKKNLGLVTGETGKGAVVLSAQSPVTSMPFSVPPQLLPPPQTAPPPPVFHIDVQSEKKKKKDKEKEEKEKTEKPEKPKKKNMTAYQVFCKEFRVNINADHPGLDFGELSKKLAEVWKQMAEKDKLVWKQRAQYLQHKQNKAEATTVKRKFSSSDGTPKSRGSSTSPHKKSPSSLLALSSSPVKVPETQPIDVAAHLQLLGESMSLIGHRLLETEGMVAVSGSLSVLLDSILCALGPLVCLTAQVPQLNSCPKEALSNTLDNIAYIMPGL
ncbi:HMG domain-containing protein 4 isoform X2 [Pleurodeles waltl]|uniref:HMG domain-containing protein 4 isoform X2 n=1 Tax=Pleurodeles waltl TaxID=8319 RepID=UPI0037097D45